MNKVLITGAVHDKLQLAANVLGDRNLLYDTDENQLYVVYGNTDKETKSGLPIKKLNLVSCSVDNDNIIKKDGKISLNEDVACKSATISPDNSGLHFYVNKILGKTVAGTATKTTVNGETVTTYPDRISILPLVKKSSIKQGTISGELYEMGNGISSSYHFSLSSNGSRCLSGATSWNKKAYFVNLTIDSETWIGIQFPSNISATIYFHGYDYRDSTIIPATLVDSKYESIEELAENISASVTVSASIATWDFTTVPDGFTDYLNNTDDAHKTFSFGSGLILTDTTKDVSISTSSTCPPNDSITGANNTGYILFNSETDNLDEKAMKVSVPSDTVLSILYSSPILGEDISRTLIVYTKDNETDTYIPISTTTTSTLTEYNDGTDSETSTNTVVNYVAQENNSTTTTTLQTDGDVTKTITTTVNTIIGNTIIQGTSEVYYVYQLNIVAGTYYIGCNSSIKIWQVSTIPTAYANKEYDSDGDFVTDQIESLPETGEDGTPYELSYSGLVLSQEDIESIAEKLKNKNRRITLDLSGCSTTWTNWNKTVFAGCKSLYSLMLPSGVNSISVSYMFNNTNLHVFKAQSDFKGFSTVDVFSGASLQYMNLTEVDVTGWTETTMVDFFSNSSLRNTTSDLEIWVNQDFYNLIQKPWGGGFWTNYDYIGYYSIDQFIVKS